MNFLKLMLSEDNGSPSTIRVVSTLVPLIIVGTWAYVSIKGGQLVTFDALDVAALLGLPAVKVAQKGKEEKKNEG